MALRAYQILYDLKADRRADVTEQFLEGLKDEDGDVRTQATAGLASAPSSKRKTVGLALLDRLEVVNDPDEYHAVVSSLESVASPDLKSRSNELVAALKQPKAGNIADRRFVEAWKAKMASAILSTLGPEEAIGVFNQLRLEDPNERTAIAGGVKGLAAYAYQNFKDMEPGRRDQLRDQFRNFGVEILARDSTVDQAKRDAPVREVVPALFRAVLEKDRRPVDESAIAAALESAARVEPEGTTMASTIAEFQRALQETHR